MVQYPIWVANSAPWTTVAQFRAAVAASITAGTPLRVVAGAAGAQSSAIGFLSLPTVKVNSNSNANFVNLASGSLWDAVRGCIKQRVRSAAGPAPPPPAPVAASHVWGCVRGGGVRVAWHTRKHYAVAVTMPGCGSLPDRRPTRSLGGCGGGGGM